MKLQNINFRIEVVCSLFILIFLFLAAEKGFSQAGSESDFKKVEKPSKDPKVILPEGEEQEILAPGYSSPSRIHHSSVPGFIDFSQLEAQLTVSQFLPWLKGNYKFSEKIEFQKLKKETDPWGNIHYTYQQSYDCIPIEHGIYKIHIKDGIIRAANGAIIKNVISSPYPNVSLTQARNQAFSLSGIHAFLWEDSLSQQYLRMRTNNPDTTYFPTGELVFVHENPGMSPQTGKMKLAWKFDLLDYEDVLSKTVYMDAQTGELIGSIPLTNLCQPASGTTTWYGSGKGFNTTASQIGSILQDNCGGDFIHTQQWNTGSTPTDFENGDPGFLWDDPIYQAAVTSHWGALKAKEFFHQEFMRNSWDDQGGGLCIFNGMPTDGYQTNASFSTHSGSMRIGSGAGNGPQDYFNPVDMVGHEFTHGVAGTSSKLIYQGESGALNESFSDIFGAMIEFWLKGKGEIDSANWLMNEKIQNPTYMRSMSSPRDDPFKDPDTYGSEDSFWLDPNGSTDFGGVHTNSGVQNYWFYLLAEGDTGTNEDMNHYDIDGIGKDTAAKIAYSTLMQLHPTAHFGDAREQSIIAASMLPNMPPNAVETVKKAWDAVGVQPDITFTPNYSSPSIKHTLLSYKVRVENNGPVLATSVKIAYQLEHTSTGNIIPLGEIIIDSLAGHSAQVERINVSLTNISPAVPPGNYYIGFELDPDNTISEKIEDNNSGKWFSPLYTMSSFQKPNLDFSLWYGNMIFDGKNITYKFMVRNTGDVAIPPSDVGHYLSLNTSISSSDFLIGTTNIPILNPGDSIDKTVTVNVDNSIPNLPGGDYYVMLKLDFDNMIDEISESDNIGYFNRGKYSYGTPNLAYLPGFSIPKWGPPKPQVLEVISRVENNSSENVNNTTLKYYLSTNTTISTSDYEIGSILVPPLNSGHNHIDTLVVDISDISPGIPENDYFIGFLIDANGDISESNESDNKAYWPAPKYDYTFPTINLAPFDSFTRPKVFLDTIIANMSVRNYGSKDTGPIDIGFYLSEDAEIEITDYLFHITTLNPLQAKQKVWYSSTPVNVEIQYPGIPNGTYFIGVIIDPINKIAETEELDNSFIWECPLYVKDGVVADIEPSISPSFHIYPNPASNQVTVEMESSVIQKGELHLINQLGQSVLKESLIPSAHKVSRILSVGHLPEGLYFIQYRSNQHSQIQKLWINH